MVGDATRHTRSTVKSGIAGLVSGKSVPKPKRKKGGRYLDMKGEITIWNGKTWRCEHDRKKPLCKECGGSSICEHNRQRSVCKECGGGGICEHGKHRYICKQCNPNQYCIHGRLRQVCKARGCGGRAVCKHKRDRAKCKDCGGKRCEHGKRCNFCKDCKATKALALSLLQPLQPLPSQQPLVATPRSPSDMAADADDAKLLASLSSGGIWEIESKIT